MRTPEEIADHICRWIENFKYVPHYKRDSIKQEIIDAIREERQHQAKLEAENKNLKSLVYEIYGSALEREGRMTKRVCLVEGFDWNAWFKKAEEVEF